MSDPKEPSNLNDNTAADWERAEDIEQELQTKIKSDMEQLPKTEHEKEAKITENESEKEVLKSDLEELNELFNKLRESMERHKDSIPDPLVGYWVEDLAKINDKLNKIKE